MNLLMLQYIIKLKICDGTGREGRVETRKNNAKSFTLILCTLQSQVDAVSLWFVLYGNKSNRIVVSRSRRGQ